MIQYLLHQQLSCACSRSHLHQPVLLELCFTSVGSRGTRNFPYTAGELEIFLMPRSHFPHIIFYLLIWWNPWNSMPQALRMVSGLDAKNRKELLETITWQRKMWKDTPTQSPALVCLCLEFEGSFNSCMKISPKLPPAYTAHNPWSRQNSQRLLWGTGTCVSSYP